MHADELGTRWSFCPECACERIASSGKISGGLYYDLVAIFEVTDVVDDVPARCSDCGTPLIAGRCLSCDARRWFSFVHRELVLLSVLVAITVAAFVGTRAMARSNETLRRRQAAAWFDAAQRASHRERPETVVAELRRAVLKDPGNRRYRLALADALATSQREVEATRVLLALRESQPEDPDTNLRLARLEARGQDADATRRYYQNAVAGLWRPEQGEERRRIRIELIEFLLSHNESARALSELLVLAANLPRDPGLLVHVGRMFLAAADPRRALDHFQNALRLNDRNADALAGAGEAAFALGDHSRVLRYLKAVPGGDARLADLREVSTLVLDADPLAPRLEPGERRKRLVVAFQQAMHRLEACVSAPPFQAPASLEGLRSEAREFQSSLALRRRREPRDFVDRGVELVYRIERAAGQNCPIPPQPLDRALVLIGRKHGFEEP